MSSSNSKTPDHRRRFVRRGNTSGLIGLWNQKVATEHSASVDAESLRLREMAARRISAREPPNLALLECYQAGVAGTKEKNQVRGLTTHTLSPASASTSAVERRVRKASEIQRPVFKIREESEGSGVFARQLLDERPPPACADQIRKTLVDEEIKDDDFCQQQQQTAAARDAPTFSFMQADDGAFFGDEKTQDDYDNDDDDDDEIFSNKLIESVKYRARRRGSKTTDDIKEETSSRSAAVAGIGGFLGHSSGGAAAGLARSKSMRSTRVAFGVMPQDATEKEGEA